MQLEERRNNTSRSMPRSYSYARQDTTEDECFRIRRISQGEKHFTDFRAACEPEVHILESNILVQRLFYGYGREE